MRLRAETMPAVTVSPRPNGLPTAITPSPTRILSLSPNLTVFSGLSLSHLQHGDVDLGVLADDLGLQLAAVGEDDDDLVGVADDVIVGDDDAGGVDDEAGAERGGFARRPRLAVHAVVLEELLEHVVERRALGQVRHGLGAVALSSIVWVAEMLTTASATSVDEIGEVGRRVWASSGAGAPARPATSASARAPRVNLRMGDHPLPGSGRSVVRANV